MGVNLDFLLTVSNVLVQSNKAVYPSMLFSTTFWVVKAEKVPKILIHRSLSNDAIFVKISVSFSRGFPYSVPNVFLFSVVSTPPPPPATTAVFGSYLSSLCS
jgi:hypothetical protein